MQFISNIRNSKIRKLLLIAIVYLFICHTAITQNKLEPNNLSVNLLLNTEQTFVNGYTTSTPLNESIESNENFQFVEISTFKPFLGWNIHSDLQNSIQTSYRILVSSNIDSLRKDKGDLWDSGKVMSNQSLNILYSGRPLEPEKVYFWKVQIADNHGNESAFSVPSQFKTAKKLHDYATDRYPLQKQDEKPISIDQTNKNGYFLDFGKAAFGRIKINLYAESTNDTVTIHLGEDQQNGHVNRNPHGSIRYSRYQIIPKSGWNTYIVTIKPDKRNTGSQAILMPDYIGEVTPFRYCEIENYAHKLKKSDISRESVYYTFNESDSYFHSSDTILNQVWELSKYSIKATSFAGVYIDGDRERIPYEADALINQLSHYCVAREYSLARHTHEYLINHPTWPTEWILQSVLIAWEDYLYTGNKLSLEEYYEDLKAKTLTTLSDESGFISTRTGKVSKEVLNSIHFNGQLRDIVDWPHDGEIDGFEFTDINTVVNAYHYQALTLMTKIAALLNKTDDSNYYKTQAEKLKKSFNAKLYDKSIGLYIDGVGSKHSSLHANLFPLAFGLVDEKNVPNIMEFIRSKDMACSVYGSQFLLEGIYNIGDAEYGLKLLTSTTDRSWYNMIHSGSTITMEAWDNKYKSNQDWNHAWGAAPANLIPRKLMGIEPIESGFKKIRIKPQPSSLRYAEIKHPTIQGEVFVKFTNEPGKIFALEIDIPANTTAKVYLPYYNKNQKVTLNEKPIKFTKDGNFAIVDNIGSGKSTLKVN